MTRLFKIVPASSRISVDRTAWGWELDDSVPKGGCYCAWRAAEHGETAFARKIRFWACYLFMSATITL